MIRITPACCATWAATLILLCAPAIGAAQSTATFTIPVENSPIVRVQLRSGNLIIRTWDRQDVFITSDGPVQIRQFTAAAVGRAMHGDDIPVFSTSVATQTGAITLPMEDFPVPAISASPHDGVVIAGQDAHNITVTLPRDSAMIWAVVGRGALRMQDYRGGSFLVRIHNGALSLSNVGGNGYAEAARGRIVIEDSAFDRIRARSAVGNILFFNCNARQIEVSTQNGSIAYDNGTFVPGLARFETSDGDVALGIAGGGAQIAAHVQAGRVLSSFLQNAQIRGTESNLEATVGGGGPVVTASSVRGMIYLYDGSFRTRPALARAWQPLQRIFTARKASGSPYQF